MDKLVLIDGNSLLNRAYYATPVFSTSSGQPTNAIFGFTKLILKIISDVKPEYFVVTFDLKAPTFRHEMYDGYKATRSPMPEELASQVKPLKSLLSAMKIAMCEQEGVEADDLIGTLSKKFDVHSYIYTGDRDSFQLVSDKTDVYYTKRGVSDLLKLSADNFESEIGLKPSAIVDLKALMGDKSDNIPGVNGIGETSARKLLNEFGTLDGVYENIDGISSPSLRKKLVDGKESAYMSYKLATIKCDCAVDLVLEKFVEHFNDIYGDNNEKFVEKYGRKFFLLYLKPIINGTGNYYLEAQTRDARRTDVIVDYLSLLYTSDAPDDIIGVDLG
ncbi:MAG: DNA polymerase I, partial [Clostridia bacterium]|nr:DNA polymerase I [Clostridia bacterium]